jgi:hypothetical protein
MTAARRHLPRTMRKSIQRRHVVAIVCFAYAVYWAAILWHGLLQGHRNLTTWLIGATLWLLFYAMAVGQRWARRLGLGVAIGGLILWPLGISWVYVFSFVGGGPFSLWMVWRFFPPIAFSSVLVMLLARPLAGQPPTFKGNANLSADK